MTLVISFPWHAIVTRTSSIMEDAITDRYTEEHLSNRHPKSQNREMRHLLASKFAETIAKYMKCISAVAWLTCPPT